MQRVTEGSNRFCFQVIQRIYWPIFFTTYIHVSNYQTLRKVCNGSRRCYIWRINWLRMTSVHWNNKLIKQYTSILFCIVLCKNMVPHIRQYMQHLNTDSSVFHEKSYGPNLTTLLWRFIDGLTREMDARQSDENTKIVTVRHGNRRLTAI